MKDMIETKLLGLIRIERSRNTVPIHDPSMQGAQIPREAMRIKIDRIRLQQKIYIQCNTQQFSEIHFGCMICSNGDIILADGSSKKLQVFDEKGNYIKDIPVPGTPSDLTEISEGRIAVTYGDGSKFEIADITDYNYKTVKLVRTTGTCLGTSWNDGQLAVKCTHKGIDLYSINGKKVMNIRDDEISFSLTHIDYIAIFEGKIYYSYSDYNYVSCLDLDGAVKWKYGSESLKHPTGITTDGHGNVYVVGRDSKNLFVISKDGKNGENYLNAKSHLGRFTLINTITDF